MTLKMPGIRLFYIWSLQTLWCKDDIGKLTSSNQIGTVEQFNLKNSK